MSGWKEAPLVDDVPAWQKAPIVSEEPEQESRPQELGTFGRFMQGMADPVVGSAQLLERSMPDAIRDPINAADRFAGGLGGASMPATTENPFWKEKAMQTGVGVVGGTATPLVSTGAARIIKPKASMNPDLGLLRREGVRPSPGQVAGGAADTIEETMTSIPFLGGAINSARGKALHDFNIAALNRATAPVGRKVTQFGQAGVKQAQQYLDEAYEAARARLSGPVMVTNRMRAAMNELREEAGSLTDSMESKFVKELDRGIGKRMQGVSISADDYKVVDSKLGKLARDLSGSQDPTQREAGELFFKMRTALREGLESQNPEAADLFRRADTGYANLIVVESAANRAVNNEGVFTPGQLGMSVRAADDSVRRRSTAGGGALMQDLSTAGENVLGNKTPNSFTADRSSMQAWLSSVGYGLIGQPGAVGLPGADLALGAAALPPIGAVSYKMTSPALRAAIGSRPPGVGLLDQIVRQGGQAARPGVGMGATGLLE